MWIVHAHDILITFNCQSKVQPSSVPKLLKIRKEYYVIQIKSTKTDELKIIIINYLLLYTHT